MMRDIILKKLKSKNIFGFELTEITKTGYEFYFIKHRLDQNRAVKTKDYSIKIYTELNGGENVGMAIGSVSPTDTEEEIDAKLEKLIFEANLVSNKPFKLNSEKLRAEKNNPNPDITKIATDFINTFSSVNETESEDLNSYEILVNEIERYQINSEGVEYHCSYPSTTIDIVVNARNENHEIELYRLLKFGSCNEEFLKSLISDLMKYGKDRLRAVPTPILPPTDVILSTDAALEVYGYFTAQTGAALKYRGISEYEIGKSITETKDGDKINLRVLNSLENSSQNFPVDEEGAYIYERDLIKDGVTVNFWGNRQFSQYLGLDKSSIVYNLSFEGGRFTADEIRSGNYLEIVEFSDFQVDSMSGDIAGEIRLGYLHRGDKTEIVTGGSISGQINDCLPNILLSKETIQYDSYVIPKVTKLPRLSITGIKQ